MLVLGLSAGWAGSSERAAAGGEWQASRGAPGGRAAIHGTTTPLLGCLGTPAARQGAPERLCTDARTCVLFIAAPLRCTRYQMSAAAAPPLPVQAEAGRRRGRPQALPRCASSFQRCSGATMLR